MGYFTENKALTKDLIIHRYEGLSKEELFGRINEALTVMGYKKKGQGLENVIYEKGDKTMRILFGAFHKYFIFSVTTTKNEEEELLLIIKNDCSEITGGIIGKKKKKKEFINLSNQLKEI